MHLQLYMFSITFIENGSDIKGLCVKVKKSALVCMGQDGPRMNGARRPRGRLAPPFSTNMVSKRNKAVMYL